MVFIGDLGYGSSFFLVYGWFGGREKRDLENYISFFKDFVSEVIRVLFVFIL